MVDFSYDGSLGSGPNVGSDMTIPDFGVSGGSSTPGLGGDSSGLTLGNSGTIFDSGNFTAGQSGLPQWAQGILQGLNIFGKGMAKSSGSGGVPQLGAGMVGFDQNRSLGSGGSGGSSGGSSSSDGGALHSQDWVKYVQIAAQIAALFA